MLNRSAKLNHNYQLPLGTDCEDLEIVDLVNCSKFLVCWNDNEKLDFQCGKYVIVVCSMIPKKDQRLHKSQIKWKIWGSAHQYERRHLQYERRRVHRHLHLQWVKPHMPHMATNMLHMATHMPHMATHLLMTNLLLVNYLNAEFRAKKIPNAPWISGNIANSHNLRNKWPNTRYRY